MKCSTDANPLSCRFKLANGYTDVFLNLHQNKNNRNQEASSGMLAAPLFSFSFFIFLFFSLSCQRNRLKPTELEIPQNDF